MADKQIAKLSVQVGIDAAQADAGLQKLGRKVADFGADISKTDALMAGLGKSAVLLGIAAAIGKMALDGAKFAASLESAAKSSDKMLERLQASADARAEFDGMGNIGQMLALPGMAWNAGAEGLGRNMMKWSEAWGINFAENAIGVLDEVRFGHTGPGLGGWMRALPGWVGDLGKAIDEGTDRAVPWGELGWGGPLMGGSEFGKSRGRTKEEKTMIDRMNEAVELNRLKFMKFLETDMSKEIGQYWDSKKSSTDLLAEKIKTLEDVRQRILDAIFNENDPVRVLGILQPSLDKVEKYKAALESDLADAIDEETGAMVDRHIEEIEQSIQKGIDEQQRRLEAANEEAEHYESLRVAAEKIAESSFTDFEKFTAAIKELDNKFAEMEKELKGADLAKAKAAIDAAKADRQKQFEAGGMTDWESLVAQREELQKQLDQATAANNQKAMDAISRRMGKLALQAVGGVPDRIPLDYFSGSTVMWGSQEQHREKWAAELPKEHILTADEKLQLANEKQDKQIEQNKRQIELLDLIAQKVKAAPVGMLFGK